MKKKTNVFDRLLFAYTVNDAGNRCWVIGSTITDEWTIEISQEELFDLYQAILPYVGEQKEAIRLQTISDIERLAKEQQLVFASIIKILKGEEDDR
jgi:hypothetical protein